MLMSAASVPKQFDETLYSLFDEYEAQNIPIAVDFRQLVSDVAFGARASHLIHTYPAKLLPHIPYFFLNNNILSLPGENILDPFSGSGTVTAKPYNIKYNYKSTI